jgi:hypothetical protein
LSTGPPICRDFVTRLAFLGFFWVFVRSPRHLGAVLTFTFIAPPPFRRR